MLFPPWCIWVEEPIDSGRFDTKIAMSSASETPFPCGQVDAQNCLLRDAVEQATEGQRQPGHPTGPDRPLLHGPVGVEEDECAGGQPDGQRPGTRRLEPAGGQLERDARDAGPPPRTPVRARAPWRSTAARLRAQRR